MRNSSSWAETKCTTILSLRDNWRKTPPVWKTVILANSKHVFLLNYERVLVSNRFSIHLPYHPSHIFPTNNIYYSPIAHPHPSTSTYRYLNTIPPTYIHMLSTPSTIGPPLSPAAPPLSFSSFLEEKT